MLTPGWRRQVARVSRFALRRLGPVGWRRHYHDDRGHSAGEVRARIEDAVLRSDALCCAILDREAVRSVLEAWFDGGRAPDQVIGALYVYESYHRGLGAHLRAARAAPGDDGS